MPLSPEEKTILGGIGGLITAGATIYAGVKKWINISSQVEEHEERLEAIDRQFLTSEGEERLLSIRTFERINAQISRVADEREKIVRLRLDQHEKKMEQMGKDVSVIKGTLSDIKADIAVLIDARKEGGRRHYDG